MCERGERRGGRRKTGGGLKKGDETGGKARERELFTMTGGIAIITAIIILHVMLCVYAPHR